MGPTDKQERLEWHRAATKRMKARLKEGDRIYAMRAECGCKHATYTFDGWDGNWIVSKSGIDTIMAATITKINGAPVTAE